MVSFNQSDISQKVTVPLWTEQVKEVLNDFGMLADFDLMRSKSKDSFKNFVKKKALLHGNEEWTLKTGQFILYIFVHTGIFNRK
jgi:hypothetical protein